MSTKEHKKKAIKNARIGVISISSTRTREDDKSGRWIIKRAAKEGHDVIFHQVIPDKSDIIIKTVVDVINDHNPQVLLLTGGTGISSQDVTIEALRPMFKKELTAFSFLFAQLSFEEIDSAALLSRATAGIIAKTILFCMPGSLKACKLACKALIFPEMGHLLKHLYE
ncbi:MAG TPA: molybdenum cofactor biosynthesis protein MoaB [Desulfobacteraceae bacterium]|nr:molybdenum cofactor biosynthesis protein MoaB [Desulfobacteraceae bacterium]